MIPTLFQILIATATLGAVTLVVVLGSRGDYSGGFDPEIWQQEQEWNQRVKDMKKWSK